MDPAATVSTSPGARPQIDPGEATSARHSDYGDQHLRRLSLIRALTEAAGPSVQKAGVVIGLIDHPEPQLFETLGKAVAALPPYADAAESDDPDADYPRAPLPRKWGSSTTRTMPRSPSSSARWRRWRRVDSR